MGLSYKDWFSQRREARQGREGMMKSMKSPRPLRSWRLCAKTLVIAVSVLPNVGCYYLQATGGQLDILAKRTPIEAIIAAPETPGETRRKLELAVEAREFAAGRLGLAHDGSFTTYVELGRPYALWSVVAAPEFSVEPLTWCFPFAGCVAYRGYFDQADAQAFAARLERRGHDVRVGGVPAYSTLGWFRDPLLDTMLTGDDLELVGLVFHELAHQRVYLKGETALNEAYATVVEEYGVACWLRARGEASRVPAYEARIAARDAFAADVAATRAALESLYAGDLDERAMRARKREILDGFAVRHSHLDEANNAYLASVSTYRERIPALWQKLVELDGDIDAFHRAVEAHGHALVAGSGVSAPRRGIPTVGCGARRPPDIAAP